MNVLLDSSNPSKATVILPVGEVLGVDYLPSCSNDGSGGHGTGPVNLDFDNVSNTLLITSRRTHYAYKILVVRVIYAVS